MTMDNTGIRNGLRKQLALIVAQYQDGSTPALSKLQHLCLANILQNLCGRHGIVSLSGPVYSSSGGTLRLRLMPRGPQSTSEVHRQPDGLRGMLVTKLCKPRIPSLSSNMWLFSVALLNIATTSHVCAI